MLAYLYCAAYFRMTMNESSPLCDQRCITESNVTSEFKKICLETHLNLVVSDTDLISFGKLFHEAVPAYGKPAFQSPGDGRVVRSWCWLMNIAGCD